MFVSIKEATRVEFLSLPSPIDGWLSREQSCLTQSCFPATLPLRRLIEQFQTFFLFQSPRHRASSTGWNHADNVAGGEPFQFVPRSNPILISNCLGHSQLKFAGHFRHVLTLSRITSLIKSDLLPSWASRNLTTA